MRDYLLKRSVSDFDVATDAPPEEVLRLFRRVVPTGIKHGTVTVLFKGLSIETTTFRTEAGYSDGRRPDAVTYARTIEEDLARRDFAMNALAYDLERDELVDPFGGQDDLSRRRIRAVGNPLERFGEDGLRPLRAIRFAAQLGFEIDPPTEAAIPLSLDRFRLVSPERVRDELQKLLLSSEPSAGLRILERTGMLAIVLPELAACRGVEQKGLHRFDVLDHSFLAADAAPADLTQRLAALLHDIGKPAAMATGPEGVPTFYRHEEESAKLAGGLLRSLRFPNATIEAVLHLISNHMFSYDDSWSDAAIRRFLARVGPGKVEDLFTLRLADGSAIAGIPADPRSLDPFRERIRLVLESDHAFGLRDLAIGGSELKGLGVESGPAMGRILAELLETVLDDPALNDKARLLEIAAKLMAKHGIGRNP